MRSIHFSVFVIAVVSIRCYAQNLCGDCTAQNINLIAGKTGWNISQSYCSITLQPQGSLQVAQNAAFGVSSYGSIVGLATSQIILYDGAWCCVDGYVEFIVDNSLRLFPNAQLYLNAYGQVVIGTGLIIGQDSVVAFDTQTVFIDDLTVGAWGSFVANSFSVTIAGDMSVADNASVFMDAGVDFFMEATSQFQAGIAFYMEIDMQSSFTMGYGSSIKFDDLTSLNISVQGSMTLGENSMIRVVEGAGIQVGMQASLNAKDDVFCAILAALVLEDQTTLTLTADSANPTIEYPVVCTQSAEALGGLLETIRSS